MYLVNVYRYVRYTFKVINYFRSTTLMYNILGGCNKVAVRRVVDPVNCNISFRVEEIMNLKSVNRVSWCRSPSNEPIDCAESDENGLTFLLLVNMACQSWHVVTQATK